MRCLALATILAASLAAASAAASERPRLVPGGSGIDAGKGLHAAPAASADLFVINGFKLGALVDVQPGRESAGNRTEVGGFASYTMESFTLGSALRSGDEHAAADISASYAADFGTAAITLGYGWSGGLSSFTPSGSPGGQMLDMIAPTSDLSLSLSFTHDLVSDVHVGGFAAASRSQYEDRSTAQGFRVGATLGWRF